MSAAVRSMERPHDRPARDSGPGPSANDAVAPSTAFPSDAHAIVEPVPVATNQGGRALRSRWRVRFRSRWGPSADPLMGWTGGGDPLDTIELRFSDRQSAEDYCRRQGLIFTCRAGRYEAARRCLPCLPVRGFVERAQHTINHAGIAGRFGQFANCELLQAREIGFRNDDLDGHCAEPLGLDALRSATRG